MTDNLQSNVLTVDSSGAIGADFSGSVTLPAGTTGSPTNQSAVKWTRTSDGALVAEVYGAEVAGEDFISIRALATAPGNSSQSFMRALDASGGVADLSISKKPSGSGAVGDFGGLVTTEAGTRTLLDDIGQSSFLQLVSKQLLALDFGRVTLTWTASNLSANATVNHGLGRAPQLVLATAFTAPAAGEIPALNTFTYTTTQFSINGDSRASGTFNCSVNWVAIG